MFKMLVFLCAGLLATLYVLGRDGGPVRDGLAGKVPPLMAETARRPVAPARLVEVEEPKAKVAQRTARVTPVVAAAAVPPAPTPAPRAERDEAALLDAAFPADETGLTLALPLVDDETPAPEAQPLAEPTVMYVSGSSVNVRSGPSADTEALTRLPRGEAVTVLPSDTPGWSLIRIEGDGVEGYIATRFLTESATQGDDF